ncbi:MAG: hypothetical protein ACT6RB_15705, partial [Neoaquamicrobium sediminum]
SGRTSAAYDRCKFLALRDFAVFCALRNAGNRRGNGLQDGEAGGGLGQPAPLAFAIVLHPLFGR